MPIWSLPPVPKSPTTGKRNSVFTGRAPDTVRVAIIVPAVIEASDSNACRRVIFSFIVLVFDPKVKIAEMKWKIKLEHRPTQAPSGKTTNSDVIKNSQGCAMGRTSPTGVAPLQARV